MTGPFTRRLLEVQDKKIHRCWWCGSWNYGPRDCDDCNAPAERPAQWHEETA